MSFCMSTDTLAKYKILCLTTFFYVVSDFSLELNDILCVFLSQITHFVYNYLSTTIQSVQNRIQQTLKYP